MNPSIQLSFARNFIPRRLAVAATTTLVAVLVTAASAPACASETATYEYDALGRLEKVTRDDGTDTTVVDYEFDDAGNRTNRTVGDGSGGGGGGSTNNPPVATNDSTSVPDRFESSYPNVLLNDSDPDGDTLVITSVTQPWNAIVTISFGGMLSVLGTNVGVGSSTYTISDGNGGTATATLTVVVNGGGGCSPDCQIP